MIVIAFGNPFDGMTVVGPFEDYEEANRYAELHAADYEDWHVITVSAPESVE